jgi:hypothetical protein
MKRLTGLLLLGLFVCSSLALAEGDLLLAPSGRPEIGYLTGSNLSTRDGSCVLGLTTEGVAFRYFSNVQAEGFKLYVDPAVDQIVPGCTPPIYPFQITSVSFYLAFGYCDSSLEVGQTTCWTVDIECPANIGTGYADQCNGPGPVLGTATVCHECTPDDWFGGFALVTAYFDPPVCVDRPFFFGAKQLSYTGDPTCRSTFISASAAAPALTCKNWVLFHPYDGFNMWSFPCWNNVYTDYGAGGWGAAFAWCEGTAGVQCTPLPCFPCESPFAGDVAEDPILITTAPWTQVINLGDYCPDYSQAVAFSGGSFTAAGPDVVLRLDFPPELPEVCFTITIAPDPTCAVFDGVFFRLRSWIADEFGAFYLGNPNFPAVGVGQTYNFTATGLGCLPNATYWLYIDTRNDGCYCPITVTYTGDTPLPVELKSFEAVSGDRMVTLNWTTATELNNDYFEVQRNAAGNWMKIGQVDGSGTTMTEHSYSYVDRAVVNGVTYSYRLLSHDINGEVHEYASTVEATPAAPVPTEYSLSQNFPNPFNPSTSISYSVKEAGFVTLKVYNLIGQEVAILVSAKMNAGQYTAAFAANDLPSGVYVYRLEVNNFVAQKKMVLLK